MIDNKGTDMTGRWNMDSLLQYRRLHKREKNYALKTATLLQEFHKP